MKRHIQYAALPWRRTKAGIEILLITTRHSRRWIVPKGWPLEEYSPSECAAYEALEEAGVVGDVANDALGSFRYTKRRRSGKIIPCQIYVYTMKVAHRRRKWPEKNERDSQWCTVEDALDRVTVPGLRRLIGKFAPRGS